MSPDIYTLEASALGFEGSKPLQVTLVKGQLHSVRLSLGKPIPTTRATIRITDDSGLPLPHIPVTVLIGSTFFAPHPLLADAHRLLSLQLPVGAKLNLLAELGDRKAKCRIEVKNPSPLTVDLTLRR